MGIIEGCLGKGGRRIRTIETVGTVRRKKTIRTVSIIVALDGIEMGKRY